MNNVIKFPEKVSKEWLEPNIVEAENLYESIKDVLVKSKTNVATMTYVLSVALALTIGDEDTEDSLSFDYKTLVDKYIKAAGHATID